MNQLKYSIVFRMKKTNDRMTNVYLTKESIGYYKLLPGYLTKDLIVRMIIRR
jgi:hypothetical protein